MAKSGGLLLAYPRRVRPPPIRHERGFTLIEVMIVVAIISLLAGIAIPGFLRYQARAKQSEAKSNLKAAYTAQKAYFGDKQTYYDVFSVIGFEPEMNNRYAYFAQVGNDQQGEIRTSAGVVHTTNTSLICPTGPQGDLTISADEQKWTNDLPPGYLAPAVKGTQINTGGWATALANIGAFPAGSCCSGGICEFATGAVGNIDNDMTLDEWFIASQGSAATGGAITCSVGGASAAGKTGDFAEGEPVNICNDVTF
jgi:type IV pilus assembly protein PilA